MWRSLLTARDPAICSHVPDFAVETSRVNDASMPEDVRTVMMVMPCAGVDPVWPASDVPSILFFY